MRKHLVALLSMFGLASSNLPAQGQAAQGSSKETPSKNEQQLKLDKQKQEKQASQAQIQDKRKDKTTPEFTRHKAAKTEYIRKQQKGVLETQGKHTKAKSEAGATKSDIHIKGEKQAAETAAGKKQSTLKLKATDKN